MKKIELQAAVWKEGGQFVSQCLDVNVSSFGNTRKEALAMLQEALELYFEDMPYPTHTTQVQEPIIASVTLQHA